MATYNWSPVLPYSIASVLDQTFQDFELLVIGDGCTDDSDEVVRSIPDPRVGWHNLNVNTGHQSGPNNEGIRRGRGDIIAYLGHDDLWLPHHLEVLVHAIDGGASLVHGTTLMVVSDNNHYALPALRWRYKSEGWIPPTSVAHTRVLVETTGGWRPPRHTGLLESETELWKRMADTAGPPRWVKRLTSVKLSATRRMGVYRERPHHEQEYWLRRIRESDVPWQEPRGFLPEFATDVRRAIRPRSRLRRHRTRRSTTTAEERRLERRKFKGLED
jgi:glycosyltransferase involved in cell wall biosynthesis